MNYPGRVLAGAAIFAMTLGVASDSTPRQKPARNEAAGSSMHILIDKSERILRVYGESDLLASYPVDLGKGCEDLRDKEAEGDGCTPEGEYTAIWRREVGHIKAYRGLLLDYPSWSDMAEAVEDGRVGVVDMAKYAYSRSVHGRPSFTTSIGGAIHIHGRGGKGRDWTDGCVAISDRNIDHLLDELGADEGIMVRIQR